MAMPMNYELIYRVRAAKVSTESLTNLENQLKNKAVAEARKVHQQYLDFLSRNLGPNVNFQVTNIACMADGVIGHVYTWEGATVRGVGKRVCCFCGCDDFDD
jgi:hypothetical protein